MAIPLFWAAFLYFICKPGQVASAKFNKKGEVLFGSFIEISDGQILEINRSVINNVTVKNKNQCLRECLGEDLCLSVNLYSAGQTNQLKCELLDWAGTAFHSHLKPKANSQSIRLATACLPNPCQNGGACIEEAGGHQYNCSCTIPFKGENCETAGCVIFDFEDGLSGWTLTGTAFNNQPTYGDNSLVRKPSEPANQIGDWYIGGYENRPSPSHSAGAIQGDRPTGTMTSPKFMIRGRSLKFVIGGGSDVNTERVELLIDGAVVARATSQTSVETMKPHTFDVSSYRGQVAQLRIVDEGTGGWGHINVDHFVDSFCSE